MNLLQYLIHCVENRTVYLGYTWNMDIEVIELDVPFINGAKRRDKTLIHEMGHLEINKTGEGTHKGYDKLTWHGIFQSRYKKNLTMPEWEYTTKELELFGK